MSHTVFCLLCLNPVLIIIAGQFISRHKINFTGIRVTEN